MADTSEDNSKKRKRRKGAVSQALLMLPFIRKYWHWVIMLFVTTALLGAAEAGRAALIEPLLNEVLLVKSDTKEKVQVVKDSWGKIEERAIEERIAAVTTGELFSVDEILRDEHIKLGVPPSAHKVTKNGLVLEGTRQRLLEVARALAKPDPEMQSRIPDSFRRSVALQLEAQRVLESEPWMALRLSLEARNVAHELSFQSAWFTLFWIVIAAAVLAIVMSLAQYASTTIGRTIVARVIIDVQNALAQHLMKQEVGYFEGSRQGEFFSRLTNDVATSQTALDVFFSDILVHPIRIVFLFLMALYFSPTLSLSLIVVGVLVLAPIKYFGKQIRRHARRRQASAASTVEGLQQMLSGIRIVKAFHREDYEAEKYRSRTSALLENMLSVIRSRIAARATLNGVNNLVVPFAFLGGGYLILKSIAGLDAGSFAGFAGACVMMYMPVKTLARAWTQLQDAASGIERIYEVFDREPAIKDAPDAVELKGVGEGIRYEDVCFSYGDKRVLHNIDFFTPAGTQTAIVGGTGHGKSTLVDLLPRFIVPESGRVSIGGQDLNKVTIASLLKQIAVVTQDAFLFNDTIFENIRYGRLDATAEEVEEAAKKSQIHDEIMAMPDGYQTVVGERGALLSGGQVQRVTIARALLKDPQILILDEATSGLDTQTERAVQEAFHELRTGRTAFVIAHRLSTIRNVDQVIVLREGHIVEKGSYDELLAKEGIFTALVRAQSLDGEVESGIATVAADAVGVDEPSHG